MLDGRMQPHAPHPGRPRAGAAGPSPCPAFDPDALVEALETIIEAFARDGESETAYAALAHEACRLLGWTRCSVFNKDPGTGAYKGHLGYRTDRPGLDEHVEKLTCATPADRFAQEVVATKRPVLIRDAQQDPRPVRSVMRHWKVRTILGVPLIAHNHVVGLLFFDDEDMVRDVDARRQEFAAMFGRLAGSLVSQATHVAEQRATLEASARHAEGLRQTLALQDRLTGLVRDGASVWDLARVAAALTANPCVVQDAAGRVVAMHRRPGGMVPPPGILDESQRRIPGVAEALDRLEPFKPTVIGPYPAAGLLHRLLVTQIALGNQPWGTLAILETGRRLAHADAVAARVIANTISLQVVVEQRTRVHGEHARAALLRDMLSTAGEAVALQRQAELLGLRSTGSHVVCLITDATGGSPPDLKWFESAWATLASPRRMWATTLAHGDLAAIIELDERQTPLAAVESVKAVLDELVRGAPGQAPVAAALSSACNKVEDYRRCFEEAGEVLRVLRTVRGEHGPLTLAADDLGAARLLLGSLERRQAECFIESNLAPLLAEDSSQELLRTLHAFIEYAFELRAAANQLGVHENTVRNRLNRILELTGLDVARDSNARLTVQVALLILRIQGRLPVAVTSPSQGV